jgi:Chlorite dismutase
MRSRVEAGGLQVAPHVGDDVGGGGRERDRRMLHEPIDVIDPEADPFQVEGADRPLERFGFFEQPGQLLFLRGHAADDGQEIGEAPLCGLAVFGRHDPAIVAPDRVKRMETGRARIQPPDLSEKGGVRDGQPQRSDDRLFMQLLAFGGCADAGAVAAHLERSGIEAVVYEDASDPRGIGILSLTQHPETFVEQVRPALNAGPCAALTLKPEFAMLGRTYAIGYEPDLRDTLIDRPRRTVLNRDWRWAVWYPLRRSGRFAQLSDQEQRTILAEHGAIGMAFGAGDYAHDIRLACHGLDRDDNDFVIGLIGKDLFPLSAVIQAMRKTQQTSLYLDRLGPFFVGRAIWQSASARHAGDQPASA